MLYTTTISVVIILFIASANQNHMHKKKSIANFERELTSTYAMFRYLVVLYCLMYCTYGTGSGYSFVSMDEYVCTVHVREWARRKELWL
jgi:hypothetical protein